MFYLLQYSQEGCPHTRGPKDHRNRRILQAKVQALEPECRIFTVMWSLGLPINGHNTGSSSVAQIIVRVPHKVSPPCGDSNLG